MVRVKYGCFFLTLLTIAMTHPRSLAYNVDTIGIYSPSMQKTSPCLVILPDSYQSNTGKRYPVLYLLHGWSGNYTSWISDAPQIVKYADAYQMMIVCPDGGYDSWYLDSPVDSQYRYETHIVRELVRYIDYYYHTVANNTGRAIGGLSMGGHGAVYLGVRNPEVFGAAGSMCGGMDLRPFRKNDWDLKKILGDPGVFGKNWEQFSVINLVENAQSVKIPLYLDCGMDDFFLSVNRAMHQRLLELHIPHIYAERPGTHDAAYWRTAIDFQIVFFHHFFEKA